MLQTLYLKHYKNTILASMFSYKFWAFWAFPLKTLCDYLWMGSIYSLKIPPKLSQKHVANVANMLKVISLTGTPHYLVRRFLECYRDVYFFLIKDKKNFSYKENCFVADPAGDLVLMPNFILFF